MTTSPSSSDDYAKAAGVLIERHRILAIIDDEIRKQSAVARGSPTAGKKIAVLQKLKRKIEGEG